METDATSGHTLKKREVELMSNSLSRFSDSKLPIDVLTLALPVQESVACVSCASVSLSVSECRGF